MAENAKRAITFILFAVGIILLIVGWTTTAYSLVTGLIIFLCLFAGSIALKIVWGLGPRRRHREKP